MTRNANGWMTVLEASRTTRIQDAVIRHWVEHGCNALPTLRIGRRKRKSDGVLLVWFDDIAAAANAHRSFKGAEVPPDWIAERAVPKEFSGISIYQLQRWRPRNETWKRKARQPKNHRGCPLLAGATVTVKRFPIRRGERIVMVPHYLRSELQQIVDAKKAPQPKAEPPQRPEPPALDGQTLVDGRPCLTISAVEKAYPVLHRPIPETVPQHVAMMPRRRGKGIGVMPETVYELDGENGIAALAAAQGQPHQPYDCQPVAFRGETWHPLPLVSRTTRLPLGTVRRFFLGEGPKWLIDRWNADVARKLRKAAVCPQVKPCRWKRVRAIHSEDAALLAHLVARKGADGEAVMATSLPADGRPAASSQMMADAVKLPAEPQSFPTTKRGRGRPKGKVKYNPIEDAALHSGLAAAGCGEKEYARRHNITLRELRRACGRVRARRCAEK